jgi:hypothetical protein
MTKTTKGVQLPLLGGWARNLAAGAMSIGGVQGKAYADLKDLDGLTNLRGLYLFYLPVTDAQLKRVSGLKCKCWGIFRAGGR